MYSLLYSDDVDDIEYVHDLGDSADYVHIYYVDDVEDVEISLESIQDGSYPISRPLYFYVKKDHYGVIPGLDAYIAEFISEEAVEGYLSDKGLVPLANPKDAIISIK